MKSVWLREFFRFALGLLLAAFFGWLIDQVAVFLFAATAAYLIIHLLNLYRLQTWLISGRAKPPESGGIWGDIFHEFYRLQRRNRQRKQRLAQLLSEFRASTAAMPEGTVVLDDNWQVIWLNDSAETLLGIDSRDVGQRIGNLVRNPLFIRYLEKRAWKEALDIVSPVDDTKRLTLHIIPYGEGHRLLLARDSTRLHRLEKMRREFVANASHELRSPLTVITGYLEAMAEDKNLYQNWQQPMDEMRRQSERMSSIVHDLLELSRLEIESSEGANTAAKETINVPELMARIRQEALALGGNAASISIESSTRAQLLGVEREIHSAFSNLVFNAVRYSPAGGSIQLRWYETAGNYCFSVTDSGEGIAQKHIPRLTERFYRVDKSRTRSKGGTGLGLAIVKHVMQRHGGQLRIESTPGMGSTFTCIFTQQRAVID